MALIDLMEDKWDELMLFDRAAYGLEREINTSTDPQQEYGVRGKVPKAPAKKYKDCNSLRGQTLGFANEFEMRQTEAYLKANSSSDYELTVFGVSRR